MPQLHFGLIGASRIASGALVPALQKAHNARAHGVAARDPQRARAFALEHGLEKNYASYAEMLEDEAIEAVYISLPNSDHREWTLKALEAGKHVLCEKPLAMNALEAQEMADASHKAGKVLLEAFMWRFHPQVARVFEVLPQVGELRNILATFSFTLEREGDIRWDPALGGGAIYDVGCYALSAARTFSGLEPLRVFALTEYSASGVDHRMNAVLEFAGNFRASLDCAFSQPMRQRVEVVGEKGTLTLEAPFVPGRSQRARLPHGAGTPEVFLNGEALEMGGADQYQLMVEHFVKAARGEEALRYPPEESVRQARALDALMESGRTGRVVEVAR